MSKDYVKIGTIEPKWEKVSKEWDDDEKEEILAFLVGAFSKYKDKDKSRYTDMNQDLCDYTRKILKINEQKIARLMTEELKKSDVMDILKNDKDFEKKVKGIINDALTEFFRIMFQHNGLFKNLVK